VKEQHIRMSVRGVEVAERVGVSEGDIKPVRVGCRACIVPGPSYQDRERRSDTVKKEKQAWRWQEEVSAREGDGCGW
jgi:hypothetical protein